MSDDRMHGEIERLQRLHRLRRIVSWVALVALSLAVFSLAYGG
jgi:hypothetical protein